MATASAFFLPMFMRAPQYRLEFFFNSLSQRRVQFERQKLLLDVLKHNPAIAYNVLASPLARKIVAPPECICTIFVMQREQNWGLSLHQALAGSHGSAIFI